MLLVWEGQRGELGDVASFAADLALKAIPAAITAGGAIGAAAITGDAAKAVAKDQERAQVISLLSQVKALETQAQAEVEVAKVQAQAVRGGLSDGEKAALVAFGLWLLLG